MGKKTGRSGQKVRDLFADESILDFFERKATYLAPRLGITDGRVRQVLATLVEFFGADWLDAEARAIKKQPFGSWCNHPIGNMIAFASGARVAEACELASYLDGLRDVPRLANVIASLRDAETFDSARLQLAFAYRFRRIGAAGLELEPPVAGGRVGDTAFDLSGQGYVAECYVPHRYPIFPTGIGDDLRSTLEEIARELESHEGHRVVMLRPKREITQNERRAIVGMTRRLIRENTDRERAAVTEAYITVDVRRIKPALVASFVPRGGENGKMTFAGGAFTAVTTRGTNEAAIAHTRRFDSHLPTTPVKDVVLAWRPVTSQAPISVAAWMDDIKEKIGDKFAQTRREDRPRGLMIVGVASLTYPDRLGEEVEQGFTTLGDRLRNRYEDNAGTLLAARMWTEGYWPAYKQRLLAGREGESLPAAVMERLDALERSLVIGRA